MNIKKMKEAAEKATPGPWMQIWDKYIIPVAHDGRRIGCSTNSQKHITEYAHVIAHVEQDNIWFTPTQIAANACHIAAANPAAVLELIASHERLVEALKSAREEIRLVANSQSVPSRAADATRALTRIDAALAAPEAA